MPDQATGLRVLMSRRRTVTSTAAVASRTVVICGSQRGVGVTTLVMNLAACRQLAQAVLIDGGSLAASEVAQRWREANQVILVTTPESEAVMNSYAVIKSHAKPSTCLQILFNKVTDHSVCEDAYARLDQSCRRFLGIETTCLGYVPIDLFLTESEGSAMSARSPESPAAQTINHIAAVMAQLLRNPSSPRLSTSEREL